MSQIQFIFAAHNHQPIGNFDFVFEEVYQKAYKPFFDVLEEFPQIKITQHYSGVLVDWLETNHPEFIDRLRKLIQNNQIEILSGAYYEAILSIIPPNDRVRQIKKLSDRIYSLFGVQPKGMWLAERVWEQAIVKEISEAGIEFLPIDEAHFQYAGKLENELYGYYTTEEQSHVIKVFPGSKKLRYTIPFAPVDETINWLRNIASESKDRIVVFADDGEKFGAWPNTYTHLYENNWLKNFFREITANVSWIRMEHFASAIKNQSALGRIYLPTASYPEMLKWALPVESANEFEEFENILNNQNLTRFNTFVRGGYWRNFLAKYPEANWLHKKMLRVSSKIQKYQDKGCDVTKAVEYLLAGQCNDAYWHGVFGGIYLTNLRFPLYQNLIKAECELDKIADNYSSIEVTDFDCDGFPEILYESSKLNLYIKPDKGGAIYETDYKSKYINILDVLSRRKEYSHNKLLQATDAQSTEGHLRESLIYDIYKHASLIDHFFEKNTTVQDFMKNSYIEIGDFVDNPYQFRLDTWDGITNIELKRRGKVLNQNIFHEIEIQKIITLKDNDCDISTTYQLTNLSGKPLNLRFGVEWNYGLLAGDATDRYYKVEGTELEDPRLKSVGSVKDISLLALVDEWLKLKIELETTSNAEFWRCPIETVSLSEAGLEIVYQSSVVISIWNIDLNDTWGITVKQRLISF